MGGQADLEAIARSHGKYPVEAFIIVGEGLRHASARLGRDQAGGDDRHLTALELVDGVLDLASERYGLLAVAVLADWGLKSGADLGAITYHLIEHGVFGKQSEDRPEDFLAAPSFVEAVRGRVASQLRAHRR